MLKWEKKIGKLQMDMSTYRAVRYTISSEKVSRIGLAEYFVERNLQIKLDLSTIFSTNIFFASKY